ncbi:MAG: cytochrome c-type biogenesis protein CcmH [bacterium]
MLHKIQLGTILLIAASAINPLQAQSSSALQEIKASLICQCDCNMTLENCEVSMTCGTVGKLTAEAQQLLDKGMEKEMVLASFVSRYGEAVLSAPTKKGFNLTAWVTPFAALILAGVGVVAVVRKWSQHRVNSKLPAKKQAATSGNPHYEKMLDDVLRDLD